MKKVENILQTGFSLVELIIGIAILALLMTMLITAYVSLQKKPQLDNATQEVMNILRLAQNQTLASQGNSKYGVYFNTATTPNTYILFRGTSYATRDTSVDKTYLVAAITEFSAITITGGGSEVVFDQLTGATQKSSSVTLWLKDDHSQVKTIYVDSSGVIGFVAPVIPPDTRTKDSRHVNFNYSRVINTASESLTVNYNNTVVQTIPIANNLSNGQIDWTGTFSVGGTNQTMTIHTLRLNSPDTQFSVFRDARFNDKAITIKISADSTGTLAEYSANGLTTAFYSIYVSGFTWQ